MWRELLASRDLSVLCDSAGGLSSVLLQGQPVTKSRLVTSKKYSMVSKMSFDIFAANHDLDTLSICGEWIL